MADERACDGRFDVACPMSTPRPRMDVSSQKSGVVFFSFFSSKKSKHELVRRKMMFLDDVSEPSMVSPIRAIRT